MFIAVSSPPPSVQALHIPEPRQKPQAVSATVGIPVHLEIPAMEISLNVKTGSFDPVTKDWSIDLSGAYYADSSMPINNSNGTTLIYGHAQSEVFARLPDIPADATAYIKTDNGYSFAYQYTSQRQVQPTDVSVFTSSGPPTLVLQTCVGIFSEYRALLYFHLVKIERI